MTKKIDFSAYGRDSYYHREWFKKNGFKFNRSSKKWIVYNILIENFPNSSSELFVEAKYFVASYEFKNGKIIAYGNYQQLLKQSNTFSEMVNIAKITNKLNI